LNPIRASIAKTPEQSDFTSIKKRITQAKKVKSPNNIHQQVPELMPFAGNPRNNMPEGIPFKLDDYLQLVDWTGRLLRDNKRGAIPDNLPPILDRLNIEAKHWLSSCQHFETQFKSFAGNQGKIKTLLQKLNKKSCHGIHTCQLVFS
jgi:hypothetical protein